MSATTVKDYLISLLTGRTLQSKLSDTVSCLDYGASVAGTAGANTTAINSAITAVAASGGSGFVLIPHGISYTEGSLVLDDEVTLVIFGSFGTVTFLCKNQGSAAIAKGGIAVKAQGHTGILLRAVDFDVAAEPILQVVDATNGDEAATATKFIEMTEISAPTTPSADKVRLYNVVDGTDSKLVAKFQDGSVVEVARQSDYALTGSAVWDPASIPVNDKATTTITVTGAALGDFVLVSFSATLSTLTATAYVSSANTVTVVLHNNVTGAVDLASMTVYVRVTKRF
jgi:hypothetical protein